MTLGIDFGLHVGTLVALFLNECSDGTFQIVDPKRIQGDQEPHLFSRPFFKHLLKIYFGVLKGSFGHPSGSMSVAVATFSDPFLFSC